VSRRVHRRHERRLLDTAAGGCEVVICLIVLRFRRLALGGRAGARLSGRLAAGVSRTTMIRLVRAMPVPAVGSSPRVLGVDEFALRKGRRYGTLLVDVETRRPVDTLPGRSAGSFADWLRARPGAEVTCRDRSGAVRRRGPRRTAGGPGGRPLAPAAQPRRGDRAGGQPSPRAPACRCLGPGRALSAGRGAGGAGAGAPAHRAGRHPGAGRHADVHRLLAEGRTQARITRDLGLSRGTVPRFARAASPEEPLVNDGTGRQAGILGEHAAYLRERWNPGCTSAAQLWAELRERGYPGGPAYVRQYLARFRGNAAGPQPKPTAPKVRAVTSWIMTSPGNLADADKAGLEAILAASPELSAVTETVRAFAGIMNERRGRTLLEPWMTAADASGEPALRSFVTDLRADQDAVTNGLSLRWSTGAVEGHVNRIILWNLICQAAQWSSPREIGGRLSW
jgi:hypothetical protein